MINGYKSTPDQRASLEPAYIHGDRKNIPEAVNAVESVLQTELLDAMPKSLADSCIRHGYCTAELINLVHHEAAHLARTSMRSPCRRRFSPAQGTTVHLRSSLQMVRRDAAPPQLVHQDEATCPPENIASLRGRDAERCHPVLSHNRQHLDDTVYAKHQLRDSDINLGQNLCHALRVPH